MVQIIITVESNLTLQNLKVEGCRLGSREHVTVCGPSLRQVLSVSVEEIDPRPQTREVDRDVPSS